MSLSSCDICMNYYFDDEYQMYMCAVDMDEDEVCRLQGDSQYKCPYFRQGDDYTIVRKQN